MNQLIWNMLFKTTMTQISKIAVHWSLQKSLNTTTFVYFSHSLGFPNRWPLLFQLLQRMEGPLSDSDPDLLKLIRSRFLIPPSTKPYNFRYEKKKRNAYLSGMLVASVVQQFYANKTNGLFVEAGALDGEYMSHTLELEISQRWTGLLVEPDKENFRELRERNRKAWITPSCLSIHRYPEEVILARKERNASASKFLTKGTLKIVQVRLSR